MRHYFIACLWSPIYIPIVLWLLAYLDAKAGFGILNHLPHWLDWLYIFLVFSLLFGGLQYLFALSIVARQINFESFRSWRLWILILPWIFTPIQLLGILLVFQYKENSVSDWIQELVHFVYYDLTIAYGYVAIWLIGYATIRAIQKTRPTREQQNKTNDHTF